MFLLMSTAQRSEGTPDHIKKIALEVNSIKQSVAIIEAGQKSGSIRKGNPLALSIAFWSSVQGIMEQLAFNPEQPKPEKEWLIDIIKNRVG